MNIVYENLTRFLGQKYAKETDLKRQKDDNARLRKELNQVKEENVHLRKNLKLTQEKLEAITPDLTNTRKIANIVGDKYSAEEIIALKKQIDVYIKQINDCIGQLRE